VAGTAAEKYKEPLIHQPSGDCSTLLLFAAESIGRNTFDKMQLLGTYLLWREEKRGRLSSSLMPICTKAVRERTRVASAQTKRLLCVKARSPLAPRARRQF
jgi:hypothetical protein